MLVVSSSMVTHILLLCLIGGMAGARAFRLSPALDLYDSRHIHSPCNFNPRCLCSVGAADYGSVLCDGVPMADIPIELQESRVFQLRLRNNQLYRFPDAKLSGSGTWGLEVSHNFVSEIPSMAFYGLEQALWELHLNHNRLTRIPSDSITLLKKLSVLNLADNLISDLRREDFRALAVSLRSLDLSGNCLTSVPEGIFWDLQRLESLHLARNNIIQIHSMAFINGVPLLSHLDLADNLMGSVPFVAVGHVKALRVMDLSHNRIERIEDPFFQGRLRLDSLMLQENNLENLSAKAFQNFEYINHTSLSSNPLRLLGADVFEGSQIKHLDVSNCLLEQVSSLAFRGLEKSLEVLDLSANRLKALPAELFADFDLVRRLRLNDNMMALSPNLTFNGFRYTIKELNLQGEDMAYVPLDEIGIMRNLRTVGLAAVTNYGSVTPGHFEDFSPSLEQLNLVDSDLTAIGRNAFQFVPSISAMDLSNNRIASVHDEAFKGVGNSLEYLKLSNCLYFRRLPNLAFHALTGLRTLDLSNNHVRDVPLDTFHKMTRLERLFLQDNEIATFKRGTFHSQANPALAVLDLSFNRIGELERDAFRFPALQQLRLNDNRIARVAAQAFVEMTKLVSLSLQGNRLTELADETFQNLHHLQRLDLAYNRFRSLNFAAFDSVGTLSSLAVDLSHNELQSLRVNRSQVAFSSMIMIMSLDLSYNNISMVEVTFFEPVQSDLKLLNMSSNILQEISPDNVGQLRRLRCIDLSRNRLHVIEPTTFMAATRLQSVHLQHNRLRSLHQSMFNSQKYLQYVDLSDNLLETLPEQLFQRTALEMFKVARNDLSEIPVKALNPVQSTLKYLDLSGNSISTISDSQLNQIQLLVVLKLADNAISSIDQEAFCCVPNLQHLDLSGNPLHRINPNTLHGVRTHLQWLSLANTSMNLLPSFQLPALKTLNVSRNQLTFVPPDTLANLSDVRALDLSHNELPAPPSSAWHSMHHLRSLNLAGNPISRIMNDSFLGLRRLEQLDISDIEAGIYQSGSLGTMPNLRRLRLNVSPLVPSLNLAGLLNTNHALEHLHLHLPENLESLRVAGSSVDGRGYVLRYQLQEALPARLKRITLEGKVIEELHPAAFKYLRSRRLHLSFHASERLHLDRDLFLNLGRVQNLSIDARPSANSNGHNHSEHSGGIRHLGNPVTTYTPNHPRAVFLESLKVAGNKWDCDCDAIGWSEKWLRRWRGVFCAESRESSECEEALQQFRSASCSQQGQRRSGGNRPSLLDELKEKLECDSFNGASSDSVAGLWIVLVIAGSVMARVDLDRIM